MNDIFQATRDAISTENIRAIQDSEGPVSQEQKRMVKVLVAKGWAKNEIMFEMQRVFGNDVLILPQLLDDERTFVGKMLPLVLVGATFSSFLMATRLGRLRMNSQFSSLAKQGAQGTKPTGSTMSAAQREDLIKKLKVKHD